jgi:glutathione synthase/RimK-type ligase-like ATP-grasp enzyme
VQLVIVGYPERLVADHAALVAAAEQAGFITELVAPSRLSLMIDAHGSRVLVDGRERRPDVVLPRGVNRPWPMIRQILDVWQRCGVAVIPSVTAAEVCADKVATTRVLAEAGVPVLPTIGVVPGDGVALAGLPDGDPLVAKPARASKARGVQAFEDLAAAERSLRDGRALVAGMVDHQVVQPLATAAGCDYRVVVADGRVVAVTRREAPDGEFVTNRDGSVVTDVHDARNTAGDVVQVAEAAAAALGLDFCGVDVIRHDGRAVVLEVNAWPGLAAQVRDDQLATSLVSVAVGRLHRH